MAEASIDSLITPKKDEVDEGSSSGYQESLSNGCSTDTRHCRTSAGSNQAGGKSLRSSAEKSESANSSQNAVPHYLRASTGSCHDFCKYGREHSAETKARKPFRKRTGKPFPHELSPIQILVSGGKKKEEVVLGGEKQEKRISVGKKEDGISVGKKKEEVVPGGEKKEERVSVGKKEEGVLTGNKKEEGISVGKKKEEGVSVIQKKGKVVSAGKKEEGVSVGEKKGKVRSAGKKKEVGVSVGREEETIGHETPTDTKDHSAYKKPSPDTKFSPAKPKTSLEKEKATMHKPSTYTNNHSPNVSSSHNKPSLPKLKSSSHAKMYSAKQNDESGNKTLLLKRAAKKSPLADPPEIVKSVFFPYTEVADSVKQGSLTDIKISGTVKKTASVAKRLIPVKLKPVKVKASSSSDDSDVMRGKDRRKLMASKPKASPKKIFAPPSTLKTKLSLNKAAQIKSGKPGNLKIVSPPKDQSRTQRISSNEASNGEKASEKTLHVISMEIGNDHSECISGDNATSSSPPSPSSTKPSTFEKSSSLSSHEEDIFESEESDAEVDELKSENNDSLETSKEATLNDVNKTMKKIRVVVPEDKHASPVKVKFRMGKVVDIQSDNNTPRRLRFRRAKILGAEDSKGDMRRKTSRKAGVNGNTADTDDSSQKVVLKHQDLQGKKDAQVLLNNVIEETASKLAVSRKSKVKALVGAFETVISLQDTKPSTTQVVS